jgi:hypothetical protein
LQFRICFSTLLALLSLSSFAAETSLHSGKPLVSPDGEISDRDIAKGRRLARTLAPPKMAKCTPPAGSVLCTEQTLAAYCGHEINHRDLDPGGPDRPGAGQ